MRSAMFQSRCRAVREGSCGWCPAQRLKQGLQSGRHIKAHTYLVSAVTAAAVEAAPIESSSPASPSISVPRPATSSPSSLPPAPLSFSHRSSLLDGNSRLMLKNLTLPELEEWCISVGEPAKRAKQLYRWLYGNRKWIRNLDQADGDPQAFSAAFKAKVGCAMNCQFCYTGRMGLLGNLSTAQILEQVVEARRYLAEQSVHIPIANIVFMGMGEPLHNYDAVMAAIEVRDWIVPTNRRYPLEQLLGVLREAFPYDKRKGDNFVVIEYVLLAGVNDSTEDAKRLLNLTNDIYCLVNLIVFNPHTGTQFSRSSKGDEQMAACGQLGGCQPHCTTCAPTAPSGEPDGQDDGGGGDAGFRSGGGTGGGGYGVQ
ncbi:hypothetical protein VOLCADRAFT_105556, partial [Volvox carteri f. nagariensis]